MKLCTVGPCALLLISFLLGACGPIQVTVNPFPPIATVVGSMPPPIGDTPAAENPPAAAVPGIGADAITFLAYGLLAIAGVAFLVALFAILRRPDRPE